MFRKCGMRSSLLLASALMALGCGANSVPFNDSVEGTVTLDNQPLGGVIVQFIPANADPAAGVVASQGISDDQGHFKLVCENQKPGAFVIQHKVVVTRGRAAHSGHRGEKPQEALSKDQRPVPSVYGVAQKTNLEVTVSADKHSGYDFALTTAGH
jgi:hypothetical protein